MATSQARKKTKAPPKASAGPLSNAARKQPGATRRLHSQGVQTIESVLRNDQDPVLGLYLHTVHILLIKSLGRNPRFRSIMPHLIGTPAILSKHPGLSQIGLAALLGTERATAGLHLKLLEDARDVIPQHEDVFAASLTASERSTLRRLLLRLISG